MTVFTDDGILMEFAWIVLIYKTAAPNFFGATEPAWCQTIFPRTGLQGVVDENDEIKRYTGIKTNMKYINNSSHHYTELLPYYAVSEAGLLISSFKRRFLRLVFSLLVGPVPLSKEALQRPHFLN